MSYNIFKNNSNCVGGKHYSATTYIRGDITQNKKHRNIRKIITWHLRNA